MIEPLWGWFALLAVRILVLVAEVVRGPGPAGRRGTRLLTGAL